MIKQKTQYRCQQCGAGFSKWQGQCFECQAWNSLQEELMPQSAHAQRLATLNGYAGVMDTAVYQLGMVSLQETTRLPTGLGEFDRVLGGGLVTGMVTLLGGDPGIGKSTLLLQMCAHLTAEKMCLYVTGEESLQQVALRSQRLQLPAAQLNVLAETQVEKIIQQAAKLQPFVIVIDSVQTIFTDSVGSAPGSITQVRESAAQLVRFAKQTGTALFLVGHVTKEGTLAGPRVLEHMVDAVLYFEGESSQRIRLLRAMKNRFGAANELGVFAMTEKGLREISNPSAIFLNRDKSSAAGSMVTITWEGSRPLLVELQALVDQSHSSPPRRLTLGVEQNRLSMLLAVLHRHAGVITYDQDVYINIVGGVRVMETSADLATLFAVCSSLRNKALPADWAVFGEVGLSGELRPVQNGVERIREAAKHGFKRIICPKANFSKTAQSEGLEIHAVLDLQQALQQVF